MGLFDGKKGLIVGIANDRSIAWHITKQVHAEGAEMGFTHLPDRDPERPKNEKKVRKLVDPIGAKFLVPCDVQDDEQLDSVFTTTKESFGKIDFLLHSIAFAPPQDLTGPVYNVSRDGFKLAMDISAYSLIALAGRAREIMNPGGSILCMTYLGGERVIPGYNLMGLCKSALESATEYIASELGKDGIRVNALSAGPVRTISASGVGDFRKMLQLYESFSPLRRNVTEEEVGKSGMFLLSDLAGGVTGETLHVDCGYHVMGGPPLDAIPAGSG
ncbi:MAG: SDR family NAD(P)-dependent oxidoreductase [Planctomycetota bacterium]|nr:MAG: SDR family NAD(P)-dependent oxidoreductase [Planctomycetota bacterium]REJ93368.1 MAG: SDR family NAD(P)-dependent oxidoreductase [Planctomycetota bacterium]REK20745.1 MAG: SDR family NAD(P)-dependent oxidoreductase [Planctomycetota bacterium]REK38073.1 MAG: SDR family NAD(P)-dependent oxidoreductase [Planctomycetota bacterium]